MAFPPSARGNRKEGHPLPHHQRQPPRDFLPPPDKLVLKEDQVKVTISLSKNSVDFFRRARAPIARQHHTSYQKMIRRVIDIDSSHYGTGA
jgi:hypothetical protein